MTPRELERAMSVLAPATRAGIGRGELAELMRAFPDKSMEAMKDG
jgi:hypothetical protein